jgi:prolyl-tRNA synthetase
MARRDNFEKIIVKEKELFKKIKSLLNDIQKELFKKAKKFLEKNITTIKNYEKFKETLKKRGGFLRACWCGNKNCEEQIKLETGATIRIIPIKKEKVFSNCIYCGKKAKSVAYFAKSY